MGTGTTLGDLLELQLHRVEEEVKNIVDKAVKEMAIEKVCIVVEFVLIYQYNILYKIMNITLIKLKENLNLLQGFGRDNPNMEHHVIIL